MIGLGIAGLIVAFIVFAELHSIKAILNRHANTVEYNQDNEAKIRNLKWTLKEQEDVIKELTSHIAEKRSQLTQHEHELLKHAKYVLSKSEN
jgi:hypothetical protein